jgi:SNF2 family DNA or RNA helicase
VSLTPHHAKYYAYDLTRRAVSGMDRLSMALFDASVDLNPHQIEAALFALQNPLSKGVILADEVGLGKTIEAGIVLCQYWAERRRRLLVICPAAIRKQWALEIQEKFNLPVVVLDAKAYREARRESRDPLHPGAILILSFHFANAIREQLRPSGRTNDNFLATSHEYYLLNSRDPSAAEACFFPLSEVPPI